MAQPKHFETKLAHMVKEEQERAGKLLDFHHKGDLSRC
jgi:hypothetical protein